MNKQKFVLTGYILWLNMVIAFQIMLPPGLICITFTFTCETGLVTVNEVQCITGAAIMSYSWLFNT